MTIYIRFFTLFILNLFLLSCVNQSARLNDAPPPPSQQAHHGEHNDHNRAAPDVSLAPEPAYTINLKPLTPLALNEPVSFRLELLDIAGNIVPHKNFKVMHGRRIHTLIIDPSLNDYKHVHLRPDDLNGQSIYDLSLTPHASGEYKIYLDVVDKNNRHYYLESSFVIPGADTPPAFNATLKKGALQQLVQAKQLQFTTQVPETIQAKQDVMLGITVKEGDQLFRKLEPTMQAYAHLVGFNSDRSKLIHAHPMGEEPHSDNQRGGPNLKFHLSFPESGYYRLFLQVRVDEKDVFVPIDVNVL